MNPLRIMSRRFLTILLSSVSVMFTTYAFAQGTWATKPPIPRSQMAVGVIQGRLYVAGGWRDAPQSALEVYNPATNAWTT